jgi:hypothetical protein
MAAQTYHRWSTFDNQHWRVPSRWPHHVESSIARALV